MTDKKEIEKLVRTRLVRLNAIVSGVVTGIIAGSGLFLATIWLVIKGGDVVGPHLGLLSQFFLGYSVTFIGSFIGFFYGFALGFACGSMVAMLYNWLLNLRTGKK